MHHQGQSIKDSSQKLFNWKFSQLACRQNVASLFLHLPACPSLLLCVDLIFTILHDSFLKIKVSLSSLLFRTLPLLFPFSLYWSHQRFQVKDLINPLMIGQLELNWPKTYKKHVTMQQKLIVLELNKHFFVCYTFDGCKF